MDNQKTMNCITREDVETFRNVALLRIAGLDDYQEFATKHANYPGKKTPLGLLYLALKLNGEAGEVAEHVGKAMRDDGLMSIADNYFCDQCTIADNYFCDQCTINAVSLTGRFTPERRALLIKEAGDVLWYLSAIANELGLSLSDIALANLEKLCDRTERNTLRGSGDER